MKRLAVVFPGIGYREDRSLLYFGRKIAEALGYESKILSYGGFPERIGRDAEKMREACETALLQSEALLADTDLSGREDILFLAKSIGTVAAAAFAARSPARERIRLVLYTPLEQTFAYPLGEAVAFTGSADPWTGGAEGRICALCAQRRIDCMLIEGANHSLESGDPLRDVENLREIMRRTDAFVRIEQLRRIARQEALLDELLEVLAAPAPSAAALAAAREKAGRLAAYYESADWRLDLAADEAGLLPRELKRGVLSEDGVYNALETLRELEEQARPTADDSDKEEQAR